MHKACKVCMTVDRKTRCGWCGMRVSSPQVIRVGIVASMWWCRMDQTRCGDGHNDACGSHTKCNIDSKCVDTHTLYALEVDKVNLFFNKMQNPLGPERTATTDTRKTWAAINLVFHQFISQTNNTHTKCLSSCGRHGTDNNKHIHNPTRG